VDVDVAGCIANAGDVEPVAALVGSARLKRVFELPELIEAAEPEGLVACGEQTHAAVEGSLEDGELAVGLGAEEKELAGLVGGEGQAYPLLAHPRGEIPGAIHFHPRFVLGGGLSRFGSHDKWSGIVR
jgi:hypothetical protein